MTGKQSFLTVRRIGVTGLFAVAALASGANAAQASPSNCSSDTYDIYTVGAYCSSGSGEFRAYTRCNATLWPDYNRYGAWTRVGAGASIASCDRIDPAFNYGVQVR
jgi:hypothetical protein